MDRSSSDQREAWGLGESETAPQRTPAAISSSRPRDHLASSKRRLASPGSTRHPARGQQRFVSLSPSLPGPAEAGVLVAGGPRLCHPPPGPRGIPAVSGFQCANMDAAEPTAPGRPSPHSPGRRLVGQRWLTLAARPRPKGFASLRNQTACRVKRQASSAPEGRWKSRCRADFHYPQIT